jgi:hypothetical protein
MTDARAPTVIRKSGRIDGTGSGTFQGSGDAAGGSGPMRLLLAQNRLGEATLRSPLSKAQWTENAQKHLRGYIFDRTADTTAVRTARASEVPAASPFSKSCPVRAIALVTCARQRIGALLTCANV